MQSVIIDFPAICPLCDPAPESWQPQPGSLESIARLTRADWRVLVVGPPVAETDPDIAPLIRLHNRLCQAAANAGGQIEAVFFCPHGRGADCDCRPPAPGLLEDIARRQQLRLSQQPCIAPVGAPLLEAAQGAGMQCLSLGEGGHFSDLDMAVQFLLEDTGC